MTLNLSGKEITDDEDIFSKITNPQKYKALDLSNNNITMLPQDLSRFSSLVKLDISNNPLRYHNLIAKSLSTLPSLRSLNIDLGEASNAILILNALPNLLMLNGKTTNEDESTVNLSINTSNINNSYSIDDNDEASLNSEVDTFNKITSKIIRHSKTNNSAFKVNFQQKLKEQISKINDNIDQPENIYKASISKSKIDIYNFLFDKIIAMISEEILSDEIEKDFFETVKLIRTRIKKNEEILYNLAVKSPSILIGKTTPTEISRIVPNDSVLPNETNQNIIFPRTPSSPNGTKRTKFQVSKQYLISILGEIFKFHVEINKRNYSNKLPKETLMSSIGSYLTYKYGLKQITENWEKQILEGIAKYSKEDSEINLFQKILYNTLEESSYEVFVELKGIADNCLKESIKKKNPYKSAAFVEKIFKSKREGFITYDEWKDILSVIFENNDEVISNRVVEYVVKKNTVDERYKEVNCQENQKEGKRHHRERSIGPQNLHVIYKEFIKLILEFQIGLKEKYLKNFVMGFRKVDIDGDGIINEEEFKEMMRNFRITDNVTEDLLDTVDPYELDMITFSDCVEALGKEKINGASILDLIMSRY